MLQPSLRLKSWPMARPASEAAGVMSTVPRGYASSWYAQNRNGSTVSQGKPSGRTSRIALGFIVLTSMVVAALAMDVPVRNLFRQRGAHAGHLQVELERLARQRVVAVQQDLVALDLHDVEHVRIAA